jgi:hypothetical protein
MPVPGPLCSQDARYAGAAPAGTPSSALGPDVSYIFVSCLNPKMGISDVDYQNEASSLNVEVAAIKAVAEVESSVGAFDQDGRPTILYERHYFHRLTMGKYSSKYPDTSNPERGGYGKFSAQYPKLERAYKLDPDTALRSASWGRFQIMGDNFRIAGFESAAWFVNAMTRAKTEHLRAFSRFVQSNGKMLAALRNKDWASFAAAYNGSAYKDNDYDTKIEAVYQRLTAKPVAAGKKP